MLRRRLFGILAALWFCVALPLTSASPPFSNGNRLFKTVNEDSSLKIDARKLVIPEAYLTGSGFIDDKRVLAFRFRMPGGGALTEDHPACRYPFSEHEDAQHKNCAGYAVVVRQVKSAAGVTSPHVQFHRLFPNGHRYESKPVNGMIFFANGVSDDYFFQNTIN